MGEIARINGKNSAAVQSRLRDRKREPLRVLNQLWGQKLRAIANRFAACFCTVRHRLV
jgi:hypothetical protein